MKRGTATTATTFLFAMVCAIPCAGQPSKATDGDSPGDGGPVETAQWPMEAVHLKNGRVHRGLILTERKREIELAEVVRPPGKPMYFLIRPIDAASVVKLDRLPQAQRKKLAARIKQFRDRIRIEAGRMEAVQLRELKSGRVRWHYIGQWFTLYSTADEETTRRSVVRIEQIFRAYRQLLPPKTNRRETLKIRLLGSMDEYGDYLKELDLSIKNPAFFLAERNLIIAGSELTRFARHLAITRQRHEAIRKQYDALAAALPGRLARLTDEMELKGFNRRQIKEHVTAQRAAWKHEYDAAMQRIAEADRRNDAAFADVTRQMFRQLYHEAFHAYLENYVYPHDLYDVPPWLNEGLAQVFESGQLEADTLRIDAPNPDALTVLQKDLAGAKPLPLADVLAAERSAFVAMHLNRDAQEKHYVYGWGLAYFLAYQYHDPLLGTAALDQYVARKSANLPPAERFEKLTGMPLEKFERQWRGTIKSLKPPK